MGIESTFNVRRSDAIDMLKKKGCTVYWNDCLERLSDMLYEHRESIFENYCVMEDDVTDDEWSRWKYCW